MKRLILAGILTGLVSACAQTENGLVFGLPDYEKRNIEVSQVDLDILVKADEILHDKGSWRKDPVRICGVSKQVNLYCALEKASIEVMGSYIHRQAALQEVRFVIDDHYRDRWNKHRLADFNAHPDTTFEDVKSVVKKAIDTVKGKLRKSKGG